MSLGDRMKDEFMEGLKEGFAGKPMEFPEGIRPLGEFHREVDDTGVVGEISPNLDDQVIDAEVIED